MSYLEKKARIFSNTEGIQSSKSMREVEYDTGRYVGFLAGFKDCEKEYEEKLRWIPVEYPPKKAELIILEYSGCSNSKNYVIYDFDPEYFEGVFHVNGVAERWRSFL